MPDAAGTKPRKPRGRPFAKGNHANPAGRPPGARNRQTLLREAVAAEQAQARAARGHDLLEALFDRAADGDMAAARLALSRSVPPAKACVQIELPDLAGAGQALAACDALIDAVTAGEVSPADAVPVQKLLEAKLRMIALARRVEPPKVEIEFVDFDREFPESPSSIREEAQCEEGIVEGGTNRTLIDEPPRTYTLDAPTSLAEDQQRAFLKDLGVTLRPHDKILRRNHANASGLVAVDPPLKLMPSRDPRTYTLSMPPSAGELAMERFLASLGINIQPADAITKCPVPSVQPALMEVKPRLVSM